MKKKEYRITFTVSEDYHILIKTRAAFKGCSIRQYCMQAIVDKLAREKQYIEENE